jgi:hypothetical protein
MKLRSKKFFFLHFSLQESHNGITTKESDLEVLNLSVSNDLAHDITFLKTRKKNNPYMLRILLKLPVYSFRLLIDRILLSIT